MPPPVNHSAQRYEGRNDNRNRPNHISENTMRITTVRPDGSAFQVTTASIRHDGEEVFNSQSEDIRLKRINELGAEGIEGKLEGSKSPNSLRLFLTKVSPEISKKELEAYFLKKFRYLEKVIIRKNPMHRHSYYASFVVLVISQEDIELDDFQDHDWPDDVRCFPAIRRQDREDF